MPRIKLGLSFIFMHFIKQLMWHVQFQVLNNLREGFQSASNRKTQSNYLGEQNSTRFIETRHTKLDKAVSIYAVFSHT